MRVDSVGEGGGRPADTCEDGRCFDDSTQLWYCVDCDSTYCDDCWPHQGPHRPQKKGRDGVPHEKVDLDIVHRLHAILDPPNDADEIRKLHRDDAKTKWFAVVRDPSAQNLFEDYGRYPALMLDRSRPRNVEMQYPQLVSFIGATNAGKSTVVKMLVEHSASGAGHPTDHFPSPVAGSRMNDNLATSGDVHLYADPGTYVDRLPIMFADCEGFEGGEKRPLGAQAYEPRNQEHDGHSRKWTQRRRIEWAKTDDLRQREYAVTTLYPRLLYNFSDCIVFVLRNAKTFPSTALPKLLDWGAAVLERSLNQPALPHCVVVLNNSNPGIPQREWDSEQATINLLSTAEGALGSDEGVPRFRELAERWRTLGKRIDSVEDLILCYYSSFTVVRIPSWPQYTLINQQTERLYGIIRSRCEISHQSKREARLIMDSEEFDTYLQSGFDHYTTHLDRPFNFMHVSLLRNPIPRDFGEHILQLCIALKARIPAHGPAYEQWIFGKLGVVLASCVLLDCVRFRKGQATELFCNYVGFFNHAMLEYLELHCPCSFVTADGLRSCTLVKARHHSKGHQDEKGIIAAGGYETSFEFDFRRRWVEQIRISTGDVQRTFWNKLNARTPPPESMAQSDEQTAFAAHTDHLESFFRLAGPATRICSGSTCFCCLMDVVQHPLPCGHALCDTCARAYGTCSRTSLSVSWCPLHRNKTQWTQPVTFNIKPREAGTRLLSLDGGGIRGIVQLEMLRGIEQALGQHLPVQAFFDLIVGTGTGGLIAAQMMDETRTLDQCQETFVAVCKRAFSSSHKTVHIFSHIARALTHRPRYHTEPLCDAMKSVFADDESFFGASTGSRSGPRVALTSASAAGRKTMLLANYRRADVGSADYSFERAHDPRDELKTWQAVCATMADPMYFDPLHFGKTYAGGGLDDVIPIRYALAEVSRIWHKQSEPDLLLSLGTGQNRTAVLKDISTSIHIGDPEDDGTGIRMTFKKVQNATRWWLRSDRDIFNAERLWQSSIEESAAGRSARDNRRRIRLSPDLGQEDPPAQDRESQMQRLSTLIRDQLRESHRARALRNVACRLVATSFYFVAEAKVVDERYGQIVSGQIRCIFEDQAPKIKGLGRILHDRCEGDFRPFFMVPCPVNMNLTMTADRISSMITHGVFEPVKVKAHFQNSTDLLSVELHLLPDDPLEPEGYTISGLPRRTSELIIDESSYPSVHSHPSVSLTRRQHTKHPAIRGTDHRGLDHGMVYERQVQQKEVRSPSKGQVTLTAARDGFGRLRPIYDNVGVARDGAGKVSDMMCRVNATPPPPYECVDDAVVPAHKRDRQPVMDAVCEG